MTNLWWVYQTPDTIEPVAGDDGIRWCSTHCSTGYGSAKLVLALKWFAEQKLATKPWQAQKIARGMMLRFSKKNAWPTEAVIKFQNAPKALGEWCFHFPRKPSVLRKHLSTGGDQNIGTFLKLVMARAFSLRGDLFLVSKTRKRILVWLSDWKLYAVHVRKWLRCSGWNCLTCWQNL